MTICFVMVVDASYLAVLSMEESVILNEKRVIRKTENHEGFNTGLCRSNL